VIFALLGDEVAIETELVSEIRAAGMPVFRSPERALRALAAVTPPARTRGAGSTGELDLSRTSAPPLPPGRGVLPEHVSKSYLAACGIPVPRGRLARNEADAGEVAAAIGFPVALKVQARGLAHKTEAGGVVLGIRDAAFLAEAWRRMLDTVARRQPGFAIDGVLVEAMASPGLEMIVGARRDPSWGPVVMVGLGGIWAEALRDVRLLSPDLDAAEIEGEIRKLKGAKLFDGLRGQPASDVDALVRIVSRIAALIRARPEIREIDLNPVVMFAAGGGAMALDALIVTE
jgi:acetate---CoA ligase (ADP-forming)